MNSLGNYCFLPTPRVIPPPLHYCEAADVYFGVGVEPVPATLVGHSDVGTKSDPEKIIQDEEQRRLKAILHIVRYNDLTPAHIRACVDMTAENASHNFKVIGDQLRKYYRETRGFMIGHADNENPKTWFPKMVNDP